MTLQDAAEIGGTIILSLGGSTVIILAFSSWLGKVWAERILAKEKAQQTQDLEDFKQKLQEAAERHKVRLKKSELIFAKEFEAASALAALNMDIRPKISHPEMDYYDACDEVASNFGRIETQLHTFVRTHGAVLPVGVKHLFSICMSITGDYKFHTSNSKIPSEANAAADMLLEHLKQAENEMLEQVNRQIET